MVFVDTAYLVALLNRRDDLHPRAEALARIWARQGTPNAIAGSVVVVGAGPVVMRVLLPSGARTAAVRLLVDGKNVSGTREGDWVRFTIDAAAERRATFWVGVP
ncbi:MAG: hypothetical protein HY906_09010 [Deltaproteobacteria bacterium]|nr:hypothetical protein [Deltaproteobacteria bacterium]